MAAAVGLVPRIVFGFRSTVRDNLHYTDDGSYLYPAGHNVVIISPDGKSHKFVSGSPECDGITAIMLSPNKKLLAVAERAEKAVISVYDMQTLKRRKQLLAADVGSKEYVSLSFSPDGKLLLAQGGGPDWNLLLWAWEKSKLASSVRSTNLQGSPVVQATMSPGESALITVVGTGVLKMFKVADQVLKPLPLTANRRDTLSFTCQTWVPMGDKGSDGAGTAAGAAGDTAKGGAGAGGISTATATTDRERQLMGTVDGEILLFEGTEPRATFAVDEGHSVESLAAHSKGFVAGLDGGLVALFDKDEREYYRRTRTFTVMDHPLAVRGLAISSSEEQLALSLLNGPAFTLALNNQELMKTDEMNFELLGPGVHTAGVTGLDMCVRRPLVATCSSDHTVRLWNYADKTCDLTKAFAEEAYSIAIHPTGLMVLVGFADKLRLLSVLMDDLKVVKEVAIKACRDVSFSNGGQYFAAVNGITLSLYSTYTCECLGNLRGHNGKVRAICWSANDSSIVSAGADGAIYEWRLSDFKRGKENVLKGCQYSAVTATPDMKTLITAGSDKKIKELEDNSGAGTQVTRELETQVLVTALALPNGGKILFAATETGVVRCYKYPLTGEFYEVKCHEGPVARLRVSYDDFLLVSAGEDSSVVLMDIRDKELAKASSRQQQEKLPWSEEVLVSKSELEERRSHVAELEQQVAELTMQTEYQLRLKDLHVQERVKELNDKFNSELETDRQKFEMLLQEKNEQEVEYEDKLRQAEARQHSQLVALDTQYQTKMMAEVERYQQLLQEKEALNERWDEQNALLVESHERVIAELAEEAEAKLAEEVLAAEALRQEKEALEKEAAETKRQLEEDADREIEELKEKYEQRLAAEREACLRLKGENGIMRKKFQALQKDIEEQREQLSLQHEQQKELYTTIKGLEKDISGLKREIRERDETIGDKERRIYELKKKNQELEKFKFVLDYKIKELKKQIEPREVEIGEMKETIRAMDSELERYHKSNAGLDLTIQNLRLKEQGLQSEVISQRGVRADTETLVRKMQFEIAEIAGVIQDPKALKEKVKALYQRHCVDPADSSSSPAAAGRGVTLRSKGPTSAGTAVQGEEVNNEYTRQRNYLEKTIESLKRKLAADSEAHRADELRIMSQNVSLIRELNELRREIKTLKSAPSVRGQGSKVGTISSITSSSSSFKASGAGKKISVAADTAIQQQQQLQQQQHQQEMTQALGRELDMQRELIAKLRTELDARDDKIKNLEAAASQRPMSRERLPSMTEGVPAAPSPGNTDAIAAKLGSSSSIKGAGSSSSARPISAGVGSSSGNRRATGDARTLSRPGSSRAGCSVLASATGVAAAVAGTPSITDVFSRERPRSSGGEEGAAHAVGIEPAPWETGAVSDTDADMAGAISHRSDEVAADQQEVASYTTAAADHAAEQAVTVE